jgi:hypothetical protein
MKASTPSKNVTRPARSRKASSKTKERERVLKYVLLLSDEMGEAVSWALNTFGPVDGFHILRKFSNLTLHFPDDLPVLKQFLTDAQFKKLTVGTHSHPAWHSICFPAFNAVARLSEKVRCYFLYKQIKNKRSVARIMGWKEREVRHTYESINKKVKALRGVV